MERPPPIAYACNVYRQTVLSDGSHVVCSDAGAVASDEGALESDQGPSKSDIGGVESDIDSLNIELSNIRSDQSREQQDAQAVPDYTPENAPEPQQIQSALAAASVATRKARPLEASARSAGAKLVRRAKRYSAKADARCTAAG
jgi:hypothetical protein